MACPMSHFFSVSNLIHLEIVLADLHQQILIGLRSRLVVLEMGEHNLCVLYQV